ncbi:hypothetical protein Dimus_003358, partial [Dionaea muscipula]
GRPAVLLVAAVLAGGGGLQLGGAVAPGMLPAFVEASIFVAGGSVAAMSVDYVGLQWVVCRPAMSPVMPQVSDAAAAMCCT